LVELKLIDETDTDAWQPVTGGFGLHNVNFERAMIRIDGVVYTERTEELEEVFDKAMTFQKLQDQ
jgi:hypothetical protein